MLNSAHINNNKILQPKESFEQLMRLAKHNLSEIIAIDSESDDKSSSIPSTEGQRTLSLKLQEFFKKLGLETSVDQSAILIATIPANDPDKTSAPALALITHIDTVEGTRAVPALSEIKNWDGSKINFPKNSRLNVSVKNYPDLEVFVGQDILHGPGDAPVGFDDKAGIAELMTLSQLLVNNPQIKHGKILLIFRPDEEIDRPQVLDGLATLLSSMGVKFGYTIDGIKAFEINAENFHASGAQVTFSGQEIPIESEHDKILTLKVNGVKSHGCSAKSEGYINSTVIFTRAFDLLQQSPNLVPISFITNPSNEVEATISILIKAESEEASDLEKEKLFSALYSVLAPHEWKGALIEVENEIAAKDFNGPITNAGHELYLHLSDFLKHSSVKPLLAEESEGFEGYSNPIKVSVLPDGRLSLIYRLRDFSREYLTIREQEIAKICASGTAKCGEPIITQQYENMAEQLKQFPQLTSWAMQALEPLNQKKELLPIRGGTGVDPFLAKGIGLANLGTGYWAAESEKEITSVQHLAKHSLWLSNLIPIVC